MRQAPNHRALADAAATTEVFKKTAETPPLRRHRAASGRRLAIRGGRGRIKPQKQHLASGLPNTPGVYYFIDKHGTTLYVGKAKDLKARVRTYFNGGDGRRKVGRLVEEVAEVRVRETESELHALILEAREIKRLLAALQLRRQGRQGELVHKAGSGRALPRTRAGLREPA